MAVIVRKENSTIGRVKVTVDQIFLIVLGFLCEWVRIKNQLEAWYGVGPNSDEAQVSGTCVLPLSLCVKERQGSS